MHSMSVPNYSHGPSHTENSYTHTMASHRPWRCSTLLGTCHPKVLDDSDCRDVLEHKEDHIHSIVFVQESPRGVGTCG